MQSLIRQYTVNLPSPISPAGDLELDLEDMVDRVLRINSLQKPQELNWLNRETPNLNTESSVTSETSRRLLSIQNTIRRQPVQS